MATKQPTGQPNPEDDPALSDYGEEDTDKPDKPDEDKPYVGVNVEKLVQHWEEEARDLTGDFTLNFADQITHKYRAAVDWISENWKAVSGSNFSESANAMYSEFGYIEFQEMRYNMARKGQVYQSQNSEGVRSWRYGTARELVDAKEKSKAMLLKRLGDRSNKMKIVQNFEAVLHELPDIGFKKEKPHQRPKARRVKKVQPVKNVAYFEGLDDVERVKAVVEDWRSIWKKELSKIMKTFTSDMREVQMSKIIETKLFPKWLERYGSAAIVPSDLLKDGKGKPYTSDTKAIRSKFKASKMELPAFMVGGKRSPAQAIKLEFVKALRNTDAGYQKHRQEYRSADESGAKQQEEEKSPGVPSKGELKTKPAKPKEEGARDDEKTSIADQLRALVAQKQNIIRW